jgi:VWFA-related protein
MQKTWRTLARLLGVMVAVAGASASSEQAPPLRSTTTAVLIDVTVVDGKGQPVTDLAAADFELREEGVPQSIVSARLVRLPSAPQVQQGGAASLPAASSAGNRADVAGVGAPVTQNPLSITAVLFDRLTLQARAGAGRAALAYIDSLGPTGDYAGIFMADLSLVTFAPFTNDRARLRSAVDRMAATAPANLRPAAPDSRVAGAFPETPPTAGAESSEGFTATDRGSGGAAGEERRAGLRSLEEMLRDMEKSYRQLLVEMEGQASIAGLTATVSALRGLPGRKTILYFSEALPVTDRIRSRLEKLIADANAAHVTIHTVDAEGLRVHSEEAKVSRVLGVAGAQGVGDAPRENGAWTKEIEHQSQVISSRPAAVLGRLAKETGGLFVDSTNDLVAGVQRMRVDRTSYYLLAYQPANAVLDGRFRRVAVKVKRSHVVVRARPGYAAIAADGAR